MGDQPLWGGPRAPAQVRARAPHAERPGEAQRGPESPESLQNQKKVDFTCVFVYQSLDQDFLSTEFAERFTHVRIEDIV